MRVQHCDSGSATRTDAMGLRTGELETLTKVCLHRAYASLEPLRWPGKKMVWCSTQTSAARPTRARRHGCFGGTA
jgi:hypothetical protein